ncbi:hypothetical protein V1J52_02725 [Streptomyces sp. TRM 70351]|uniref:hypothetical protein n=1 Tax=Streptomyces sp. TRM 70351 TaxID=3116552 RepID=UPI002E7C39C4|nr:hypothetical protein [Streptomyces sp. TRM 70351]MEE1927106.1 hypothetical protein [Streptomyces sp. TRM 70351]
MNTVVIIAVVAVLVVLLAAGLYMARAKGGGRDLKRRFGPEYERVLDRHHGDKKAAEEELGARLDRHGSLRPHPLPPQAKEGYAQQWTAVQERFVDAPQQAVAEAEQLLAHVAQETGFPPAQPYEEQVDALSVHHADHVDGYRQVHAAARGEYGTEQMRGAMIEARALFDDLVGADASTGSHHRKERETS